MATTDELAQALRSIAPRSALVLAHRFLDAHTASECAVRYGLTLEAFDVLLLRSAQPFVQKFGSPPPLPDAFAAEQAEATALRTALESDAADARATPLRELFTHRVEVRALLDQADAAYQRSPAARRETWLRRIAIVVVVALSAYFYWREREASRPHLEARPTAAP